MTYFNIEISQMSKEAMRSNDKGSQLVKLRTKKKTGQFQQPYISPHLTGLNSPVRNTMIVPNVLKLLRLCIARDHGNQIKSIKN